MLANWMCYWHIHTLQGSRELFGLALEDLGMSGGTGACTMQVMVHLRSDNIEETASTEVLR
jgi:hypothetical protein